MSKGRTPDVTGLPTKVIESVPTCPDYLSPVARDEWERIVPELAAHANVCERDVALLASYCELYAAWRMCMAKYREDGPIVENDKGTTKVNPALRQAAQLAVELRNLGKEFGFTPNSRRRLDVDSAGPDGEQAALSSWLVEG